MPHPRWSRLPNLITVARIAMAPAVFFLVFIPTFGARLLAFLLFLAAAISDLWDGYLARKHGWITDFGKLVDPLADKLLVIATLVPIYIISHQPDPIGRIPVWGTLPLWIVLVIFGREAIITIVRGYAAKAGIVIPAGQAGKYKAFLQNVFAGATILWFALRTEALREGWSGGFWTAWRIFHGSVVALSLLVAVVLTLYSLGVYLWGWRRLLVEASRR